MDGRWGRGTDSSTCQPAGLVTYSSNDCDRHRLLSTNAGSLCPLRRGGVRARRSERRAPPPPPRRDGASRTGRSDRARALEPASERRCGSIDSLRHCRRSSPWCRRKCSGDRPSIRVGCGGIREGLVVAEPTNIDVASPIEPTPSEICQLSRLGSLGFTGSPLTGASPSEIGTLTSLDGLGFSDKLLTGSMPESMDYFSALRRLYIKNPDIIFLTAAQPSRFGTGVERACPARFPPGWSRLTQLQSLILRHNNFSGPVPAEFDPFFELTTG
jgi:hypothetical protein